VNNVSVYKSGRYRESSGKDQTEMSWDLERIDETNLVERVRKESVRGHIKRGRPKKP